jgi:hypothetical protein
MYLYRKRHKKVDKNRCARRHAKEKAKNRRRKAGRGSPQ